jgi:hypothetical protein
MKKSVHESLYKSITAVDDEAWLLGIEPMAIVVNDADGNLVSICIDVTWLGLASTVTQKRTP